MAPAPIAAPLHKGAFAQGRVDSLSDPWVLEDRDFVFSIALSPDSKRAAFTVLRAPDVKVIVSKLSPLVPEASVSVVGHYSMDVEAVAFSPDEKALATVSRDGSVRIFSGEDGKPLGGHATEEPLVSLAFHPSGDYVLAGSARGLITALHFPSLQFASEERLHSDEVRALAFAPNGTLYSGGWDKKIVASSTREETLAPTKIRMRYERQGSTPLVRGTVDGVGGLFALNGRAPFVLIGSELAKAMGVKPEDLKETVSVATAVGKALGRVVHGRTVALKTLAFARQDVVVCDACLPQGAHGVIGVPLMKDLDVAFDEVTQELQLTRKGRRPPEPVTTLVFGPPKEMPQEAFVNDVTVDHVGNVLGVAISKDKAERSVAVREREKKGDKPARDVLDAGLRVEAATGKVLDRWSVHQGVVSSAAVSPDGQTLATGGWDGKVFLQSAGRPKPVLERQQGWIVRRVRISADGRLLAVGAWTPPKASQDAHSEPAALVYELGYSTKP
ncbi:MAG: aspartyl protease family protein [Myxococcaceae bacterium]